MGLGGEHVEGQLARLLLHFVQRSQLLKIAYHRWQRNGIILVAKRVLFLSVRIAIARRRARADERPGNHYSSALDSMESYLKRLSLTKYLETPPGVFVVLAARWHRPRWPRAVLGFLGGRELRTRTLPALPVSFGIPKEVNNLSYYSLSTRSAEAGLFTLQSRKKECEKMKFAMN